jgi:hypothetical protein
MTTETPIKFPVPTVCHARWNSADWDRWINSSRPRSVWQFESCGYTWRATGKFDAKGEMTYRIINKEVTN